MSLRKRSRPSMKRTTSVSELAWDPDLDPDGVYRIRIPHPKERQRAAAAVPAATPPKRGQRRRTEDLTAVEAAQFLKACGLCKRRLGPGQDTFIYRGEAAFCSMECREQQMKQDELKEKCSRRSTKGDAPPPNSGAEATGSSETVAAA